MAIQVSVPSKGSMELETGAGRNTDALQQQNQLLAYARDLSSTYAQLRDAQTRLQSLCLSTLTSLAATIEARDPYLVGHSRSVASYAVQLGSELGLPSERVETLHRAGLLHDIGKIGVPDSVLRKTGRLDRRGWQQMRRHPELGYQIVSRLDFLGEAVDGVRYHHERYDGRGYPCGLAGASIPLTARILSACDALDAMLSNRVYRQAMPPDLAAEELLNGRGSQFDPEIADLLVRVVTNSGGRPAAPG